MLCYSKKSIFSFCLTLFFVGFLLTACQPDRLDDLAVVQEEPTVRAFPGVDPELWPYFERFEEEGKKRGISIDLVARRITGEIDDLEGEHVAGQCNFFSGFRPNHVIIDSEFWERASDIFKEFIIFHELGHCYLNRDHREDAFTNGRCVSIMRSGNEDCRDNYNIATRTAYINELFRPEQVN